MNDERNKMSIIEYFDNLPIEKLEDLEELQRRAHSNAQFAHGHGNNRKLPIHKALKELASKEKVPLAEIIGKCEEVMRTLLLILEPPIRPNPSLFDIPFSKALLQLLIDYTPSEKEQRLQNSLGRLMAHARTLSPRLNKPRP